MVSQQRFKQLSIKSFARKTFIFLKIQIEFCHELNSVTDSYKEWEAGGAGGGEGGGTGK